MSYKPNDPYIKEFVTSNPTTGAAANADSLPVATANRNGTDDGSFSLTVTNIDSGRYKITGTIPIGYAKGDVLNVSVAATCSSIAGKAIVDTQVLDSKRVGDLNDIAATAIVSSGAITTSSGAVSNVTTTATATNLANLPSVPTDWLTAAGVKADAVTKVQAGLATPTNITAGTITTVTTTTNLTNPAAITSNVKKNQVLNNYEFVMTDSTTHAPKPSLGSGVTATRSLDGGSFAACANAVAEVANGTYKINLATTDMNANVIMLLFTAIGADDLSVSIITKP